MRNTQSEPDPIPLLQGPQDVKVPVRAEDRAQCRTCVAEYVAANLLVPPLTIEELERHARKLAIQKGSPPEWHDFLTVLLSNALWRDTFATIPFDRRILLLPQCLRDKDNCPAEMDELGLLCEECGRCQIGPLQAKAEALGYIVLVAEGTTVVTRLIEQGTIDAVVGVSCLSVLERAFPHMAAEAIPGIAIPLLRDGCVDTEVDAAWVEDTLALSSTNAYWLTRIDIDALRAEVDQWFTPPAIRSVLGEPGSSAELLAQEWLCKGGKRWRPFLSAAVYRALNGPMPQLPDSLRRIAMAVECFHKASLIHDDIEDNDELRYGEPTLHRVHGVPKSINIGDLLLGFGYRLIGSSGAEPERVLEMLAIAAEGHCDLCLGQGEELHAIEGETPIPVQATLDIFRRKTAPAFEVALRLGAAAASADQACQDMLRQYSMAIGTAYQIKDDLDDLRPGIDADNEKSLRASLIMAITYELASERDQASIRALFKTDAMINAKNTQILPLIEKYETHQRARQLFQHYRNEAIRTLAPARNAQLKSILRRLVGRLLKDG